MTIILSNRKWYTKLSIYGEDEGFYEDCDIYNLNKCKILSFKYNTLKFEGGYKFYNISIPLMSSHSTLNLLVIDILSYLDRWKEREMIIEFINYIISKDNQKYISL